MPTIRRLGVAALVLGLKGLAPAATWSNITEYPAVPLNKIARITTTGVITEYGVPSAARFGQPAAITAGLDGALWFTAYYLSDIGRAPVCGLGLSASFANGTLTMSFNLGIDTAADWFASLHTSTGGVEQLWLAPIPAVVPPDSFTRMLGPGFPNVGELTVISGLETAPGQGLCYETATANTAQ
jgi:hypothetical protein